jgi:hypothetical protein
MTQRQGPHTSHMPDSLRHKIVTYETIRYKLYAISQLEQLANNRGDLRPDRGGYTTIREFPAS